MDTRRSFLGKVALGAAAAATPRPAAAGAIPEVLAADEPPTWLLAPLEPGDPLGLGWRLVAVGRPRRGAVALQLAHPEAGTAVVQLCARGEPPAGIETTRRFDLLLMDGGRGDRPTDEPLARAIRVLAARIRANEDRGAVDGLAPHAERLARFGPDPA